MLACVFRAVREHDLPDGQRDDQRVQPHDPDEDSVGEADERPEAESDEDPDRESVVRPDAHADEHVPAEGDHAGGRQVDASLHDHEHLPDCGYRRGSSRTGGCTTTTYSRACWVRRVRPRRSSAAIASQMGRKRAATSPLATTCADRPIVAPSATRSLSPGELMDRSIESGRTVKSQPQPGIHSAHLEREVSTVTERTACVVHRMRTASIASEATANPLQQGELPTLGRLTPRRPGVYARCTSGSATRPAAGGRTRALARYRCPAGQGEWHELAADCFPKRLRGLDGPRHRRDPERRGPRRGRRHRGRRSPTSAYRTRRRSTRPA